MAAQHSTLKWTPLGYAQGTVTNAAQGFGALGITVPIDAIMALISVEGSIRWRDDKTPPTPTIGMPMVAGQEFQYTVPDFTQIQFIAQSVNVTFNVSFYK